MEATTRHSVTVGLTVRPEEPPLGVLSAFWRGGWERHAVRRMTIDYRPDAEPSVYCEGFKIGKDGEEGTTVQRHNGIPLSRVLVSLIDEYRPEGYASFSVDTLTTWVRQLSQAS